GIDDSYNSGARPVSVDPGLAWLEHDSNFSRRLLRPPWVFGAHLFLLRLAISQRHPRRNLGTSPGYDDAHRGRNFHRVYLFERGRARSSRRIILLGAGDADRRHAPWTLAGNEVRHGSLARPGDVGSTSPGDRSPAESR